MRKADVIALSLLQAAAGPVRAASDDHVGTLVLMEARVLGVESRYSEVYPSPPRSATHPTRMLAVSAVGMVNDYGYEVFLVRRRYKTPPADGIYEFDLFCARDRRGIHPQSFIERRATCRWDDPPADIKGVRVWGSGGYLELRDWKSGKANSP